MNMYHVQYKSDDGNWLCFCMNSNDIYEALDWVHENLQRSGVSVCKMEAH